MINLQDYVGNSKLFKKYQVDELLFTEFKCPIEGREPLWWHNNFFAYVLSGETLLQTPKNKYILKAGDCLFAKKGAVITHSKLPGDFCELLVFVPDSFIKTVFQKYNISLMSNATGRKSDTVIPLAADDILRSYFHSLLSYFNLSEPPSQILLRLKFEELIVSIIGNNKHAPVKYYFSEVCVNSKPSIRAIMEANFPYSLTLTEFARLCTRSLSQFKVEFELLYHTTPGTWLREKRLEYSRLLLETTDHHVDEVCYAAGFKNKSHFIREFKRKYGRTPGKYKISRAHGAVTI